MPLWLQLTLLTLGVLVGAVALRFCAGDEPRNLDDRDDSTDEQDPDVLIAA